MLCQEKDFPSPKAQRIQGIYLEMEFVRHFTPAGFPDFSILPSENEYIAAFLAKPNSNANSLQFICLNFSLNSANHTERLIFYANA